MKARLQTFDSNWHGVNEKNTLPAKRDGTTSIVLTGTLVRIGQLLCAMPVRVWLQFMPSPKYALFAGLDGKTLIDFMGFSLYIVRAGPFLTVHFTKQWNVQRVNKPISICILGSYAESVLLLFLVVTYSLFGGLMAFRNLRNSHLKNIK